MPLKQCVGQLMVKDSFENMKEHYSFMFENSTQSYNGYIKNGVVGKQWLAGKDEYVCKVCKENVEAGVIPIDAKFPSGHLYPPAGKLCRCALQPAILLS